ncbi:MAG: Smr/MutS family protein [Acidobacteria bacterium]|nr:Smr/MutS family protein [Acidobacteriota bacterium]
MSADTRTLLEFDDLLQLVGGYTRSPLGKARLGAVAPTTEDVRTARLQLAAEAREYLHGHSGMDAAASGAPPASRNPFSATLPLDFSGFTDPSPILVKLAVEGASLEIAEIQELLHLAERALDIRRALVATRGRFPHLAAEAERIADFHSLVRQLGGKILPSGELDDRASASLQRIRHDLDRQRALILSSLRRLLQGHPEESQQEIITIRADRYVVPVRSDRKSRVPGVVHGSSSSGQTLFVEPLEAIEPNNELVRLREEEQREVHRILLAMTAQLRERAADLAQTADCLGTLEFAFACGRFALDYDCAIPRFSSGGREARLLLKDARHPLLESLLRKQGTSVVPLTLQLEGDNRVLVISGPNTGGKTVALKTVGLLALMALSGLPVPAADAEFPPLEQVLADIGDYQSIQESLSTFSAHLLNISSMLRSATGSALVLLDEPGTATDQEEGGALGVAVVDRFRAMGAFTLATTHSLALKTYAMNAPDILSASMGFDEQSLEPTFRLEIGWPGQSSGLAIAQRLGLPQEVLDRARQVLSTAHQQLEQLLSRARAEENHLVRLRQELEEKLAEAAQREKEWAETIRQRETERLAEWEKQLESLWNALERRAEEKLRELGQRVSRPARAADVRKEAARLTSKLRQQAREQVRQTVVSHVSGADQEASAEPLAYHREPAVGDTVVLKGLGRSGIVRQRTEHWLEVEMGRLRTRVPPDEVKEVIPTPAKPPEPKGAKVSVYLDKVSEASLAEINVIGETAEEARRRVDKFLDNAVLAQIPRVRVVHGFGKGILRQALAEMFADHPHVGKFSPAPLEEGGAGATIVELKV